MKRIGFNDLFLGLGFLALLSALPALRAADTWHVVRGEYFDVYTNDRPREGVETAVWLEQFQLCLSEVLQIHPSSLDRARIVRFKRKKDFEPYKPLVAGKTAKLVAAMLARGKGYVAMALTESFSDDSSRQQVQHECVHWLLSGRPEQRPRWLEEGLAELYSSFELNGDTYELFRAPPEHVFWLSQNKLTPLAQHFSMDMEDIGYQDIQRTGQFYAQSWLIVHYCLRGAKSDRGKSLEAYLMARERGVPSEEAFQQAFGKSYAEVEKALDRYLQSGQYYVRRTTVDRARLERNFKAEPAPACEVEIALGLLSLGANRFDDAERHLENARRLDPEHAGVYEALAALALRGSDQDQAAQWYREAIQRGSQNPFALYYSAQCELRDRLGTNPRDYFVPHEIARRLSNQLKTAINRNPFLYDAYEQLGLAQEFLRTIDDNELSWTERGLQIRPDRPGTLRYRRAVLLAKAERVEEARALFQTLSESAESENVRSASGRQLQRLAQTEDERSRRLAIILRPDRAQPQFRIGN